MRFISFKFVNAPQMAPIEYSYQADAENAIGDVVKVRCEEYPVPDLTECIKRLSKPVVYKMFGPEVADAPLPFRYGVFGLELRAAGDKKPWREEVAFYLMLGNIFQEVKVKTPFFGLFDTYEGSTPGTRENNNHEVLGQDSTYGVRQLIDHCMAYINGTRAQMVLEFGEQDKAPALPGLDDATAMDEG